MAIHHINKIIIILVATGFLYGFSAISAFSESRVDELQQEIGQKNEEIEKIEKEIEQYQSKLNMTTQEKNTLKNEVNRLEITEKKLGAELNLTQKKLATQILLLKS